jgi:hypothetical protein
MKIGGEYRLRDIRLPEWVKLARELRFAPDTIVSRVRSMAARLPDEVRAITAAARADGLDAPFLDRLAAAIAERAALCATLLREPPQ